MGSIVRGSSINGSASVHQSFQMYISLEQFCCSLYSCQHVIISHGVTRHSSVIIVGTWSNSVSKSFMRDSVRDALDACPS